MKKIIALVLAMMMVMLAACAEEAALFDVLEDEPIETVAAADFEEEVFAEIINAPETAEITIHADRDAYEMGDTVHLSANICASRGFRVYWEVNAGSGWQSTGVEGESFSYTADENTATNVYRAVLVMA